MSQVKSQFVQCLPIPATGQYIRAVVLEATEDHAKWWALHVQESIKLDDSRPDKNWNWLSIVKGTHPLVWFARRLGQKSKAYCIVAANDLDLLVPIAMVLLVEPYPFLFDNTKDAPFLWFLAAAPGDVLRRHLANQRPSLLQALIDVGIVFSFECGYEGRLCLHSDPKGGAALAKKYEGCGLQVLSQNIHLPTGRELLRRMDVGATDGGAYFYADTQHAQAIVMRSDYLRCYPPKLS